MSINNVNALLRTVGPNAELMHRLSQAPSLTAVTSNSYLMCAAKIAGGAVLGFIASKIALYVLPKFNESLQIVIPRTMASAVLLVGGVAGSYALGGIEAAVSALVFTGLNVFLHVRKVKKEKANEKIINDAKNKVLEAERQAAAQAAKEAAAKLAAEKAKADADKVAAEKAKDAALAAKVAADKAKSDAAKVAADKAKAVADQLAAQKAKEAAAKLAADKAKEAAANKAARAARKAERNAARKTSPKKAPPSIDSVMVTRNKAVDPLMMGLKETSKHIAHLEQSIETDSATVKTLEPKSDKADLKRLQEKIADEKAQISQLRARLVTLSDKAGNK